MVLSWELEAVGYESLIFKILNMSKDKSKVNSVCHRQESPVGGH